MANRTLTKAEAGEILYEGHFEGQDYEVIQDEQYSSSRWSGFHEAVLKRDDGTFWCLMYSRGLTEMQDEGIEDAEIFEAVPKEKTVIEYVRKETPNVATVPPPHAFPPVPERGDREE